MANVTLPPNEYVDLYAATGISSAAQIKVTNLTPNDVRLFDTGIEPTSSDDHFPCLFGRATVTNEATDAGAWAMCSAGGAVDVKEV